MDDLLLCGWRVRSELPIPELVTWTGDDRQPDIRVHLGEIPEFPQVAKRASPFLRIAPNRDCLLERDGIAIYWIGENGREVVISPLLPPEAPQIRIFLLGTVLGLLCHLRGLFPLHASVLHRNGSVLAFAGHSGAGKSTIAGFLAQNGFELVSDDLCVIDTSKDVPRVRPAFPRLRLRDDSLGELSLAKGERIQNVDNWEKYIAHPESILAEYSRELPLRAVLELTTPPWGQAANIARTQWVGRTAEILHTHTYRRRAAEALGCAANIFRAQCRIAGSIPIFELALERDFGRISEVLTLLEREGLDL